MKPFGLLALAFALALAGCISLPEAPEAEDEPHVDPPVERISGMTAEVSFVDVVVDCQDGGLPIPPGRTCVERTLDAVGRIGVDELPIDLDTVNGAIAITTSPDDSWSFHAVIKVRGVTEESARQGLDTTWSWSHEVEGGHALRASPTPAATAPSGIEGLGATLEGAAYAVTLPAWVRVDIDLATTNGAIVVEGFEIGSLRAATTNGAVAVEGKARDVSVDTSNGAVALAILTTQSGTIHASTTNGAIVLELTEDDRRGYDLAAETTNGDIDIGLEDGRVSDGAGAEVGHERKTFETDGYASRDLRTKVDLATTNGRIDVLSA